MRPIRKWTNGQHVLLGLVTLLFFATASGSAANGATSAAGTPLVTGFPRLSLWCPDLRSQPLQDIARNDYVALYPGDGWAVPQLRSLNPAIKLLVFNSPVEVSLDHAVIMDIPNEWFLTQVGTKLTAPVSNTASTFAVSNSSVFRVGELAVVGSELVRVTSVGAATISVTRGVLPERAAASSHASGTRVAAVVSNRADEIELDISTYCPKVIVDPDIGPETWGQYAARLHTERAMSMSADGVICDRVEGGESYYVVAGLTRSIDPARTNVQPSDAYAAFDAAWNNGIRSYIQDVRSRLGADKIVMGNNASGNHDLLNGSNIEGFPKFMNLSSVLGSGTYSQYWNRSWGIYANWAKSGVQPNFSTVMTYHDELSKETGRDLQPAGAPDYQKMRFGLTTALMADGFFSYQLTVWGPRVSPYWFDEYDNAGASKGYLGGPLGAAGPAFPQLSSPNAIGGGTFSSLADLSQWYSYVAPGYAATTSLDSGAARVQVTKSSGDRTRVALHRDEVALKAGSHYTLTFRARADKSMKIAAHVGQKFSPWRDWLGFYDLQLDTEWRTFELSEASSGTDPAARLVFDLGATTGTVWLDDVTLQQGTRVDVYRRDFDNGIALVNGSDQTVTVPLEKAYRHIKGTQVPSVNSGLLTYSVTIPPRDGRILLRSTSTLTVTPFSGADRFGTSVLVSRKAYPSGAATVIIATGRNWPDALGGAALAGAWDAPILLCDTNALPDSLRVEIGRLKATRAIILGGPAAVGAGVESGLSAAGISEITRIGGSNRYVTAGLIAEATISKLGSRYDGTAFVATSLNYPDALAASPLAAAKGWPVYLANPTAAPSTLAAHMKADGVKKAVVLGSTKAVSATYETTMRSSLGEAGRIWGSDRYSTGVAIATYSVEHAGLGWDRLAITTGQNFPDALTGGVLQAKSGSVMLLTPAAYLHPGVASSLRTNRAAIHEVRFLGSTKALSNAVRLSTQNALE